MDFSPISKDFDSQGTAASRSAHFPHIFRASRQMTAAARHNAACLGGVLRPVVLVDLAPLFPCCRGEAAQW